MTSSNSKTALISLEKAREKKIEIQDLEKERVRQYVELHGNKGAHIISEHLNIPVKAVNRHKRALGIPTLYDGFETEKEHYKAVYESRKSHVKKLQQRHQAVTSFLKTGWKKKDTQSIRRALNLK